MNRIRMAAIAVATVVAAMALVGSAGHATAGIDGCTTFVYRVHGLGGYAYDWEWDGPMDQDVNRAEAILPNGIYVRGTGGSRDNGWTPVEHYRYSTGVPWASLLEGPNDTHDFVRTSGLDYLYCS